MNHPTVGSSIKIEYFMFRYSIRDASWNDEVFTWKRNILYIWKALRFSFSKYTLYYTPFNRVRSKIMKEATSYIHFKWMLRTENKQLKREILHRIPLLYGYYNSFKNTWNSEFNTCKSGRIDCILMRGIFTACWILYILPLLLKNADKYKGILL